ncbi:MAG: alpha/beta hydrolase, partial [Lachnospiraceae bacterium]|nr:alpha/beta hydrolase [Lachnospiraceae bacterium]
MDIEHFYVEKGNGDPLILLHGNGEDSSYFKGQVD